MNKSIKIVKTNRGGKITYHGPGQIICYFVIDLKKRKKDIIIYFFVKTKLGTKLLCNSSKKKINDDQEEKTRKHTP